LRGSLDEGKYISTIVKKKNMILENIDKGKESENSQGIVGGWY